MKALLRRGFSGAVRRFQGMGLGRIPLVRSMERAIRAHLKNSSAMVMGHQMELDADDILDLSINGIYEPVETAWIQSRLVPGDVVVDLGAHVGYYTLLCAKLVGSHGKVFAFEPFPEHFELLKRNIKANGYENVALVRMAVADTTGTRHLFLSEDNSGDHRIFGAGGHRRAIEIETITLDDYFRGNSMPIALIKLDIQGAEYAALQGMLRVLSRNRVAALLTEFWPRGLLAYGVEPERYLNLLLAQGFRLLEVDRLTGHILPTSPPVLMRKYMNAPFNDTSLLCLKDRPIPVSGGETERKLR
jgi:FkbM family methyltransferase